MSHTLAYLLGIVVLVVGIGLSVALHELGHMIPAKRFGVKVPEYFIGFGPRIWSFRRGETEYGIKAIWLGGYVRLLGMVPPAPPGRVDRPDSVVAQARAQALTELGPDEQDRAFYRLSVPRKLVVMAGGILTNLALGVMCLAVAMGVVGAPAYTPTLARVEATVSLAGSASGSGSASSSAAGSATESVDAAASGSVPSPAAVAGLRAGDTILSWDGRAVRTWTDVQEAIVASGTQASDVVVSREGRTEKLTVTPVLVARPVYDSAGQPVTDASGAQVTQERPFVGVSPRLGTVRVPAGQVAGVVGQAVTGTLKAIITIPAGLYHAVAAGLGLEERDESGLISLVGMGRIAGEMASAGTGEGSGAAVVVPFSVRLYSMLSLLGSLNLALFAFNLIPLLPLDGGHVAGALWEGLRRQVARWRGRPDPGYVDTARMLPVGQVVFVALVVMAVVLIWVDLVAPV